MNKIISRAIAGIIFLFVLVWMSLQIRPLSALAAVTLSSFTATPSDGQILIEWETGSELDMEGFYLKRSLQEDGTYERISGLIWAEGEEFSGWYYSHLDTDVTNGTEYFYILEAVEIDQDIEEHGPISAVAGVPTATFTPSTTPTNTSSVTPGGPTLTLSNTPSKTPSITPGGPTLTPSRTRTKTPTRTPSRTASRTPFGTPPPTATNTGTATNTPLGPTATATITPTATLAEMPILAYTVETTPSNTPVATASPTSTPTPEPADNKPEGFLQTLAESDNLPRIGLIIIVIAAWAVLAIGAYIYFRRRL